MAVVETINVDEMLPAEIDYETLKRILEQDSQFAWHDTIKHALAESKITKGDDMYARFVSTMLSDLDGVGYNEYQSAIKETGEELLAERQSDSVEERGPPEVPKPDEPTDWETVQATVLRNYDEQMLDVVEALCANTLVLLFENVSNAPMLFVEGASGAGKTTVIAFMEGTSDELLIRADSITSASFKPYLLK